MLMNSDSWPANRLEMLRAEMEGENRLHRVLGPWR